VADEREERIARNETLFREVNERIEDISRRNAAGDGLEFLCECGRRDCLEALGVSRPAYEAVRSHGDRFLVAPGHQAPDVEHVVEEHEGYLVVQKMGEAGDIAEAADPRS
jgi:hypothetical protein